MLRVKTISRKRPPLRSTRTYYCNFLNIFSERLAVFRFWLVHGGFLSISNGFLPTFTFPLFSRTTFRIIWIFAAPKVADMKDFRRFFAPATPLLLYTALCVRACGTKARAKAISRLLCADNCFLLFSHRRRFERPDDEEGLPRDPRPAAESS